MSNEKIIASIEREIKKAEKQLERLKDSLAILTGKQPQRKGNKRRTKRRQSLQPGKLPALVFDVLKDINKPSTLAEIAIALNKKRGIGVRTRTLSVALARFVRDERFFRVTTNGRYEYIEE